MFIDVTQNLQNPVVPGFHRFRHRCRGAPQVPAHLHQQLQQQTAAEDDVAVVPVGHLLLQPGHQGQQSTALLLIGPQHMAQLPGEALRQVALRSRLPPQKLRRNVDDDPLVGVPGLEFRPVDTVAADEDQIPRLEGVAVALHGVAAAAGHQQQEFAEFVIMEVHPTLLRLAEVEEAVIVQQITPAFIVL